ncbi:PrsW family intramembrane metalloprotease [Amycolatopsis taiwanensis]|nr:PrsW family glutamic-type intramembrane protease [Amycolatopsis taiwanensis]
MSHQVAPRTDRRTRWVMLIAVLLSAAMAVQVLINLASPKVDPAGTSLNGTMSLLPALSVAFWWLVTSWIVVLAVLVPLAVGRVRTSRDPGERVRRARFFHLAIAAVLVSPFCVYPVNSMFGHVPLLLLCLPTTAFGLWTVHRMQRHRRMPFRIALFGFGWGALIAFGFGGLMNVWTGDTVNRFLLHRVTDAIDVGLDNFQGLIKATQETQHDVMSAGFLSAGVGEELGKGAGVAIVYLLCRRHFDNVVSGIVVGAAVGIGFNLAETVDYLATTAGGASQYWARQYVGLMGTHVAFTALVGAGFGVVRQLGDPRRRWLPVACALVAAIGGHFTFDAGTRVYTTLSAEWFGSPNDYVSVLVLQPLGMIVLFGPFVVMYVLLLRRGLRDQLAALRVELAAEANTGFGAVTPAEVSLLLRPGMRWWLRFRTFRSGGTGAYRALARLHAAQLDLGMQRWHRSRSEVDPGAPDETVLRRRVLELKHQLATVALSPQQQSFVEVPA